MNGKLEALIGIILWDIGAKVRGPRWTLLSGVCILPATMLTDNQGLSFVAICETPLE